MSRNGQLDAALQAVFTSFTSSFTRLSVSIDRSSLMIFRRDQADLAAALMWPSVTIQPAMLPTLLNLYTWRISAWPCSFSRSSGVSCRTALFQVVKDLVDHAVRFHVM